MGEKENGMDRKDMAKWAKECLRINLIETHGSYGGGGNVRVDLDVFNGEEWETVSQDWFDLPDCD